MLNKWRGVNWRRGETSSYPPCTSTRSVVYAVCAVQCFVTSLDTWCWQGWVMPCSQWGDMQAACVPAWRLQYERTQAAYEHMKPAYRRNVSCITPVCRMQHAAAYCIIMTLLCRLLQPACRLLQHACDHMQTAAGITRMHFEKCTWLVKCCRFKAAQPPWRTSWAIDCPSRAVPTWVEML